MNTLLVVARLGLAAVFVVAAVAKLADMKGSRAALEGFNVPAPFVPTAAVALPCAEVASAVLLVIGPTAQIGAALAVLLLVLFVAGIAAALRRGARPDCHCFGQLHSKPAGGETIVRNGLLAAIALVVLIGGPGPAVDTWARASSGEVIALGALSLVAVVLAYVCYSLTTENRRLTGRGAQAEPAIVLEPGQPIPRFDALDAAGATLSSSDILNGSERSVLVFMSTSCGPCIGLLPELARWRRMLVGRVAIHALSAGDATEAHRLGEEHELPVLFDGDSAAANALGIQGTPSAVAVDDSGHLLAAVAVGAPSIEGLIRVILKRPTGPVTIDVQQVPGRAPA